MAATQTRYTPEDLLAITDRPMPELVDGQLVERNMGQKADAVAARIVKRLADHAEPKGLGLVNGSGCGYQIFTDDPEKVRLPDASFTRAGRLTAPLGADGHSRVAPDLVVEVISPNDNASDLWNKVEEYLAAGVPLVWVFNPEGASVQIYHLDGSAKLLGAAAIIDGEDVLPGFSCRVGEFFGL